MALGGQSSFFPLVAGLDSEVSLRRTNCSGKEDGSATPSLFMRSREWGRRCWRPVFRYEAHGEQRDSRGYEELRYKNRVSFEYQSLARQMAGGQKNC